MGRRKVEIRGDPESLAVEEDQRTSTEARVKEEAVEQFDSEEEEEEEEEDQMPISQFRIISRSPVDHFSKVKVETPSEPERKRGRPRKIPPDPKIETTQVRASPDIPSISERGKRRRPMVESADHFSVQSSATLERAEEIQANLDPGFPSFIKLMLRSHVTKGFWLGLPSGFCKFHLPRHDDTIVLEGESGEAYKTNYLAKKGGLSGGWRRFSIAHNLLEGDVVVFHLIKPCKFKVYIVRANDLADIDGALGLLDLDAYAKEPDFEKAIGTFKKKMKERLRFLSPDILQENVQNALVNCGLVTDQSQSGREDLSSECTDNLELSGSFVGFENFNIIVNGTSVSSKLTKHLQRKYYELCCTRRSYLHNHLLNCITHTLAAGIISETIVIADAIRASKLSTSQDDFASWDKTLEAFELLGMDVGFLRARIKRLVRLAFQPRVTAELERYKEARCERDQAEDRVRILELKLLELKQARIGLDHELEVLNENAQRYEQAFKEEVSAPWC